MKRSPLRRKTALTQRSRMRRFSPVMQIKTRVYTAQRKKFLAAHPWCEVVYYVVNGRIAPRGAVTFEKKTRSGHVLSRVVVKRCHRASSQVHHMRGRGRWHNDERFFFPVCAKHHGWITANGKAATRLGYVERIFRP